MGIINKKYEFLGSQSNDVSSKLNVENYKSSNMARRIQLSTLPSFTSISNLSEKFLR